MKTMNGVMIGAVAAAVVAGCCQFRCPCACDGGAVRVAALDDALWAESQWLEVPGGEVKVYRGWQYEKGQTAASGTSWFVRELKNPGEIVKATWMTAGLGVYDVYVNGKKIGADFLKPGFTDARKTKYSFTYDVTAAFKTGADEVNYLAAEVSAGWWRDKIVNYVGRKSAFRGVLLLQTADGRRVTVGTDTANWKCGFGGPVTHAGIFDGERYDARVARPCFGEATFVAPLVSTNFPGKIFPTAGAEVTLRRDIALKPVEAYRWKGVKGANQLNDLKNKQTIFGTVVKTVVYDDPTAELEVVPGETLVVDFGQNAAAVPALRMRAKEGTVLTVLPGEMLNDANGERSRGNDGPAGSIYRENLRIPATGMQIVYTFGAGDDWVCYHPTKTFFGYRYISVTATAPVAIKCLRSIPVTSIQKEHEIGSIETGVADVNRLIANVYWGQLSNYLSVPTDCPQRNERLGWTADTQVFTEAGAFNADTSAFFHKFMHDMRDMQDAKGGFPGVAPFAQYGNEPMRFCWADCGIIVPYQIWRQFGDRKIVNDNWAAMEKYVARVNETKYDYEATKGDNGGFQWADWLSYEDLESCSGRAYEQNDKKEWVLKKDTIVYWNYLGAWYWLWDARMMAAMARDTGRDAAKYEQMAAAAKAYLKQNFFEADGLILKPLRKLQTPALCALKLGLVEGAAKEKTLAGLVANIKEHGDCLQTGFLGTSILMDTLTEAGRPDVAYTLLLQHKNPSWLYSVDQGATTIWERWNSYVKETGFGEVGMNSFNHYAYGAVLAWIYHTAAGIVADETKPGFKSIVMRPVPDRRLGYVKASYNSAAGLVKSAWRYDGATWIWDFTVPEGATARVTLPGETSEKIFAAGDHRIEKVLP